MLKFLILFLLFNNFALSQSYKDVLIQIFDNNKELKTYKEYFKGLIIESKINILPPNPEVEYSYLSGNSTTRTNYKELIISQSFDFPSNYFLKSDIASIQNSVYLFQLKVFEQNLIKEVQNLLIDYIYWNKKVEALNNQYILADEMLSGVQVRFDKGDIGVLELNKAKSVFAYIKTKLNLAKIELSSVYSQLLNLNGGFNLQINIDEYWLFIDDLNSETLLNRLKEANYNYKALIEEEKLYNKKISLAKSGWLPNFDIGYRQDSEYDNKYSGFRLQMSIPLFENTNKVRKAKSDYDFIDLKIELFNSKFKLEKKTLFDKSLQLKTSIDELSTLVDFKILELNKLSFERGHISLTQFYLDNTIFYEITDTILETEREYQKILVELLIELVNI